MSIFENLEEIFQDWRSYSEYAKSLVTFATAIGTIIIFYYTLKIVYETYSCFRLYVCSQLCCKGNLKKYGKWVVISGATDGIGLAMAKEFARRGHSILVVSRNEEKLASTKEQLEQIENVGEVETVRIDLSDSRLENYNRIKPLIDPDNRDIGILVNNAGFFQSRFKRFNNNTTEDLLNIVNVNVLGTVHLTRMIMPGMISRGRGLVVNVSSIMGNQQLPYTNLYAETKVFINRFTQSLQMEYAGHPGLDIVCLTPGPVHTKLFENMETRFRSSWFIPNADDYAISSINCFGTGFKKYCGTALHGFINVLGIWSDFCGVTPYYARIGSFLYPNTVQLSPIQKRKVYQQTEINAQAGEQENALNTSITT